MRQPKFVSKYASPPDDSWVDKDQLRMLVSMQEQTKEVTSEIKGLETTAHRLARMIPGVREVDRTYRNILRMQHGYTGIAMINFALIAWRIVRMINQYFDQKKRQEQEMEAAIREVRNITTHESYMQWKTGQRTEMNSARTRNISM
ncbi:MAG: hypothetical protein FWF66_03580 [Candidatus Bathyarchaeota archaeon]|nr:hypothetical protein [Candidatus Termiticorpusculum sp.]MCL1970521.1 hypothetical protein [Candidatus Termiticorpusculum sp.]